MVKNICFICFILVYSLSFSQTSSVEKRLIKKMSDFHQEDYKKIQFNSLYLREEVYETGKDFEATGPKLEVSAHYEDFLYFYDNGKVLFFVSENHKTAELLIKQNQYPFDAVLSKENNKTIIYRALPRASIFGISTGQSISKQELRTMNNKIYIQTDNMCYVYSLIH